MIFALAFTLSAIVCLLIVRSAHLHLRYTADLPGAQPQKFHSEPVPRVGGVGVMAAILLSGLWLPLSPPDVRLYWLLMLALLPAFAGGLAEDMTRRVGAGPRLLLTVLTAACARWFADVHFVRSDMGWLDKALAFPPFGWAALLFAVAGVAQAVNIIDGYHGLAAGFAAITLVAMGYVAQAVGDPFLATFCGIAAAATVGFLVLNYPLGRIFLGDGGAYLLGCIIALAGAMLVLRDRQVSPWFPLALVIYPVWETLFSMLRRAFLYRTRLWKPDAHHLHSLVYRHLSWRWLPSGADTLRNPVTSLPFWAICSLLALGTTAWYDSTRVMEAFTAAFPPLYCLAYWGLARRTAPVNASVDATP